MPSDPASSADPASPARLLDTGSPFDTGANPEDGTALCLSGGGYRAMLFHVGALRRLNEATLLQGLARVSSVSGGSIAAAVLALAWPRLAFQNGVAQRFDDEVTAPLRRLASRTLDEGAVLTGILTPGSIGDKLTAAYDRHLFHGATLQDLPDDAPDAAGVRHAPRFVLNATNLQSAVLWRFSRPFMGDYRVGLVRNPRLPLARAVAASSAFPPVLSPVEIDLDPAAFDPTTGQGLQHPPYTDEVVLSDGGVYDNLGLETAWKRYKTVLVSDGGGHLADAPEPKRDWARHAVRVLNVIDNQVRSLRKRQTIDAYKRGDREGTYWGIRTDVADYGLPASGPDAPLRCPHGRTLALADTPTRLKRMPDALQERLINWGYAVTDAALRRHVVPALPSPTDFPYPASAV